MSDLLDRIVRQTRRDLETRQALQPELSATPSSRPGAFREALSGPELSLLAELKPRSPSQGPLREDVTEAYPAYRARASAVSVLVDTPFFGGGYGLFETTRKALGLPLLAKGFFVDPWQVDEARAHGADAVLLIARILDDDHMAALLAQIEGLGMDALIEVHTDRELDRALAVGAQILGVNARDLDSLAIDLEAARTRLDRIPKDRVRVAESGLESRADVDRVRGLAHAALIGTAFMSAPDIGAAMERLGW